MLHRIMVRMNLTVRWHYIEQWLSTSPQYIREHIYMFYEYSQKPWIYKYRWTWTQWNNRGEQLSIKVVCPLQRQNYLVLLVEGWGSADWSSGGWVSECCSSECCSSGALRLKKCVKLPHWYCSLITSLWSRFASPRSLKCSDQIFTLADCVRWMSESVASVCVGARFICIYIYVL